MGETNPGVKMDIIRASSRGLGRDAMNIKSPFRRDQLVLSLSLLRKHDRGGKGKGSKSKESHELEEEGKFIGNWFKRAREHARKKGVEDERREGDGGDLNALFRVLRRVKTDIYGGRGSLQKRVRSQRRKKTMQGKEKTLAETG
jgi:hypothetical protein